MNDYVKSWSAQQLNEGFASWSALAAAGGGNAANVQENLAAIKGEIDRRALNQKLMIAAAMVAVFFLMK